MSKKHNPYVGDARTRAAKQRGYPARSVFKLEEIDKRVGLLRSGQRVLDLGAAPGSWSLYASQKVGNHGLVMAVDLQPITQPFAANVQVKQGDARELAEDLVAANQERFDVVLSDMAPSTTGNKILDQAESYELFATALSLAGRLGKEGSHFVAKLFMSPEFEAAKRDLAGQYQSVKVIRPRGTRSESSELFLVGLNRRKRESS